MKKKTVLLIISLLLFVSAAGCGHSKETNFPKSNFAASADTDTEEEVSPKKKKSLSGDKAGEGSLSADTAGDGSGSLRLVRTYFDLSRSTENDGFIYFQSFGNHIYCTLETETAHPKLAKVLRNIADEEEKDFKAEIKEYERDAFEYEESVRSSGGEGYYYHYSDDIVKRADNKCVSIVRVMNGYLGGAHPDFYYQTFNLDTSTGAEIPLSDVISDQGKLNEILERKLLEDYPDVEFFGLKDSLAEYNMSLTAQSDDEENEYIYDFTLDPDGVSFYFSPYGISAYAYGDQVVKILYEEEPSLFKKDYAAGGAFVSHLTDMDNKYGFNGKAEKIKVERDDYDDNNYFGSINVYKGNNMLTVGDLYYYSQASFLAHTGNGKDFAYVFANMDNDYKQLFCIDLNGSAPVQTELDADMKYCFADYLDEASGIYGVILPMDPDSLDLGVRCDMLSSYTASGEFEVLDNGKLRLKDKYLMIPEDTFVLTALTDFKADIVDEDGMVKENGADIAKDSELTLYRTDGVGIVDAKLGDGRIVRLNVDGDYPHKINDSVNEDKLFKGMMYAG